MESCEKTPSSYNTGKWLYADSITILNSRNSEDKYVSNPLIFGRPESLTCIAPMKTEPTYHLATLLLEPLTHDG